MRQHQKLYKKNKIILTGVKEVTYKKGKPVRNRNKKPQSYMLKDIPLSYKL